MSNTFFTSDLHLFHDKNFVYEARGFSSIDEMNEAIVERYNSVVRDDDFVFILGDIALNNYDKGLEYIGRLRGHKWLIIGNHDMSKSRIAKCKESGHFFNVVTADVLIDGKRTFYLSHYPTITSNGEEKYFPINLYGHTHQKDNFYNNNPKMYHVGVDSHNCYPVSLEEIKTDIRNKIAEGHNI